MRVMSAGVYLEAVMSGGVFVRGSYVMESFL